MNEIKCPHCSKSFNLDDAGYADILKQVRNHEFEIELQQREAELERRKHDALKLADSEANVKLQESLNAKEREFAAQREKTERELSELRAQIGNFELQKTLALKDALSSIEQERNKLAQELETERRMKDYELQNLKTQHEERLRSELDRKNDEIRMKDEAVSRGD